MLATAGDDGTARLWEMPGGRCRGVLSGHSGWVDDCAFSADGELLATAGNDGTVRVWRAATGECLSAVRLSGPLLGVAWHPDGDLVAAVGSAGVAVLRHRTAIGAL
jgi:WD40 repeat protein